MIRIGVDVGGTNTDAVVMDGTRVVAWAKTTSTPDATTGLVTAVREALARSGVAPQAVRAVMVGTTRFTNAVVERRELAPTAVVRLGLPATLSVPPLTDWPPELRAAIDARTYADGMGRAFPELRMETFAIYGVAPVPAAIADDKGAVTVWDTPMGARELERVARARCIEMGGSAGMAHVMRGRDAKRAAIPGSVSLALRLGRAVLEARERKADPIAAALGVTGGRVLLRGKIVDVERRTTQGFARGRVRIAGEDGRHLEIDFQNEHLIAREIRGGSKGRVTRTGDPAPAQGASRRVVASVPDLIRIVASDDAEPIGTELLRYAYRVAVLGLPAHPLLRTPEALAVVGPRAFGYDVEFVPLSD